MKRTQCMTRKKDISVQLQIFAITLMVIFSGLAVLPAQAQDYDLVILNGRVMDPESKLDAVRNVGVKDGKIAAVTKDAIKGKETIDAKDHVVAPGFIDTHSHNTLQPFGRKLALRDGVTTPLELECGVQPVDEWYASMEGKSQSNYGATVSIMGVRETVFNPNFKTVTGATINDLEMGQQTGVTMKWSTQVPTDAEIKKIIALLDDGLKQGALGIGNTAGYMTGGFTSQEAYAAQELAAKYGRFVSMHGRFSSQEPPTSGVLGIEEQLGALAAVGGGLLVCHMTAQTLDLTADALELIDQARSNGHQVVAEIYAYTYGSTIVGADYLKPDNYQNNMGRDYKDITEVNTGKPLTKERYEELMKTAPGTTVTFENAQKEDLYLGLAHPTSIIASDSFPYAAKSDGSLVEDWDTSYDSVNGHPRGAGT